MSSLLTTLPNVARVHLVVFSPSYSTICSIGKAPFYGELSLMYRPDVLLLEFVSFEEWLHSLANLTMTIEGLNRLVFDVLSEALGDIPLHVTVHARTTVHAPVSATIERGIW
jgi:NADPH-dependent 7-cyano-7-deazaguanine reductase QueF